MSDFAIIRPWLFVGNRNACGKSPAMACVHINRSDYPGNDCCRHRHSVQVELDYKDGEVISDSNIANLCAFSKMINQVDGLALKTLVHCHAGMCRSPTVAAFILGMVERDIHPMDCFSIVEKAIYDQQENGKVCNIVYAPKRQICRLLETLRK